MQLLQRLWGQPNLYTRDNIGACGSRYGESDRNRDVRGREILVNGNVEQMWTTEGTRYFLADTWRRLDRDLAETWQRLDGQLAKTWQRLGGHLADTWRISN